MNPRKLCTVNQSFTIHFTDGTMPLSLCVGDELWMDEAGRLVAGEPWDERLKRAVPDSDEV